MKTPVVTDHAILRYLERVMGVDVEWVRRTIAANTAAAVAMGATSVSKDGVTYSIREGGKISTVLPDQSPSAATYNGFKANGENKRIRQRSRAEIGKHLRREAGRP